MKFFRKILHKYILKTRTYTVQLRGRLKGSDQDLLKHSGNKYYINVVAFCKRLSSAKRLLILEIGFGNGSHIVQLCKNNPETLVVGCEMYLAGVATTLKLAKKNNVENLVVTSADIRQVLTKIAPSTLGKVYILFPDPWPKARHRKRRLLDEKFLRQVVVATKTAGEVIIATDWAEYAADIESALQRLQLENVGQIVEIKAEKKQALLTTTFAKRAQKAAREVYIRKFIKQ